MAFTKINAAGIGTTETVTVDGLTVINDGSFGGNLTVSGVLTYEDVTNVDSVGLITARNGIVVGSGITLSKDGDVFFTGIATGNGSGLTALNASNLASGTVPTARLGSGTASSSTFLRGDSTFATVTSTTINNNANNRVITGSGTADTLEGESSFTYDGNGMVDIEGTGAAGIQIKTPNNTDGGIYYRTGSSNPGAVTYQHSDNSMRFRVNSTEKARIHSGGQVQIAGDSTASISSFADDLIIGESGSTAINGITLCSTDSSGIRFHDTADMGEIEFDHSDNSLAIKANQILKFRTNNAERFRITSDGHLRIGNDTGIIQLGTGQDLQLIHDGSASKIIAKPEFILQSDEFSFRNENGSSIHAIINSSGQVGIGTNIPGDAVSINGNVRFASGTSVGGSTMGIFPLGDITLAGNASASLALNARFTGIVIVSGYQNDTAAAVFALASASDYSSDSATRLHYQSHAAANTTDLTISSPSHGGTHQFQLNQTGTATKTYKVIAFGIKG